MKKIFKQMILAILLSVSLVSIMSIDASARTYQGKEVPDSYDCNDCSEHPGIQHCYTTGGDFVSGDTEGTVIVYGVVYTPTGATIPMIPPCSSGLRARAALFAEGYEADRWYYYDSLAGGYYPCSGHSTPDPVFIPVLAPCEAPAPAPVPDVPVHIHEFTEGTIYEATCDHDGLEGTYCSTCGFIKESSPISAFGYTLDTYAQQKMDVAKSGQNIVLEFGELSSFPKSFMEKIAEKVAAGVSFEFRYKVNHKLQKIKIPAYSTVDTSLDWYGHDKMAELYGMN